MTFLDDQVLVRVLRGSVGPVTREDGYLVRLAADVAADLVLCGDAVAVPEAAAVAQLEGAVRISTTGNPETAPVPSSDVGRKRRISE